MNTSLPNGHGNPETRLEDPVYIFTDKATAPPPKGDPNPPVAPNDLPPRPEPGNTDAAG